MKVKVIYAHNAGYVDTSELNALIQAGKIMAFEREYKLAVVGFHPTRKPSRKTAQKKHASDRRRSDG